MKFISDRQRRAVMANICRNKFAISPAIVEGYTGSKIYTDPYGGGSPGIIMDDVPIEKVRDTAILAGEHYRMSPTKEDVIRSRNIELMEGMPVYSETPKKEYIRGGYAEGRDVSEFDSEQIRKGIEVEKEHVIRFTDKGNVRKFGPKELAIAEEISKDHCAEIPDYYDRLEAMEEGAKADGMFIDVIEQKKAEAEMSGPDEFAHSPNKVIVKSPQDIEIYKEDFLRDVSQTPLARDVVRSLPRHYIEELKANGEVMDDWEGNYLQHLKDYKGRNREYD
jgi:hypothetical protein